MKTKHLLLLILLFILTPRAQAQENYLVGYEQKISGTDFTYHSLFSYWEKVLKFSSSNKNVYQRPIGNPSMLNRQVAG